MRRDQVLKICVNHYVTPALVAGFKEKDSKSWTWAAQDYSDGELTGMTFALRLVFPKSISVFALLYRSILPCVHIVSPFFLIQKCVELLTMNYNYYWGNINKKIRR
jgi:hypothetical protein